MKSKLFSWILPLVFCILIVFFNGCVPRKKTILFQKSAGDSLIDVKIPENYLVQYGDILYVKVQSLDDKASAFINGQADEKATNVFSQSEQYLYFNGYEVEQNGYIRLPYLDSIKVVGMTTDQIANKLTEMMTQFIKDALITVKLASFRVCIYGEVQNPGAYLFFHKRVSIFELIASAKPSEYYNAKNVVITRQSIHNQIKIERVDLTSSKILGSPYYYLQPNDQIYIEPLRVKKYGFNTFPYALLLSTISTIMIIYSIIKK
jgi:polysaccharide biosynthesis/export protein